VLVDLGVLGLRGWQSVGGFLVLRIVCVVYLYHVLLITHSRPLELHLLHLYPSGYSHQFFVLQVPPLQWFRHHPSLPLLPLKALSWGTTSTRISQLFLSATSGFTAFSTLDRVLWCLDQARTWGGRCAD
jgi:hypothetical protein